MTTTSNYEFNESQNELFADLAKKMNFVGILMLVGGIISLILGIVVIINVIVNGAPLNGSLNSIIQGVFLIFVGTWTRKASMAFSRIVKTTNSDIENLMIAMGELRKLYTLQYILAIITVVFIALAFILGIIGGLMTVVN